MLEIHEHNVHCGNSRAAGHGNQTNILCCTNKDAACQLCNVMEPTARDEDRRGNGRYANVLLIVISCYHQMNPSLRDVANVIAQPTSRFLRFLTSFQGWLTGSLHIMLELALKTVIPVALQSGFSVRRSARYETSSATRRTRSSGHCGGLLLWRRTRDDSVFTLNK